MVDTEVDTGMDTGGQMEERNGVVEEIEDKMEEEDTGD